MQDVQQHDTFQYESVHGAVKNEVLLYLMFA